MKKKFCRGFLALTFTLLCLKIPAQQALKIGETLPETFWTTPLQVVNHPDKTITLDKDRGKLILLDFWATWCGTCLTNFPKMEALQQQYGDRLTVLPVTEQSRALVEKFFATKNGQRFKNLRSTVDDRVLKSLFPYKAIPFIVWIKDGKLLTTTDAGQVTEENIQKVLGNDTSPLQTVLQISRERPLMLSENFDLEKETNLQHYTLFTRGRIRAIGAGTGFHREGTTVYGRQFTNLTVGQIYGAISSEIFAAQGEQFSFKRLVHRNGMKDEFAAAGEERCSFEYIVPVHLADRLYTDMLAALNTYSGYTAKMEKQQHQCLILVRSNGTENPDMHSKKRAAHPSVKGLMANLNENNNFTALPVLDESGYDSEINVRLGSMKNMSDVCAALTKYGLEFRKAQRNILMLNITKNP